MSPVGRTLSALVATVLLAGCAPDDPYDAPANGGEARDAADTATAATDPGELPGRAPTKLLDRPARFPEARVTASATLTHAALLAGNWTSATASRQLARLTRLATGQARAEWRQAAVQAGTDRQQHSVRSRTAVEVIGIKPIGPRSRGLVVTRETVRAPDLPAEGSRYRVTLATLDRRGDRWVISRWAPQP